MFKCGGGVKLFFLQLPLPHCFVCAFQTSITLLWTLYELARHPSLQEELRAEVAAARADSQGDMMEMLKRIPLVKGALKETLRWTQEMIYYVVDSLCRLSSNDPSGCTQWQWACRGTYQRISLFKITTFQLGWVQLLLLYLVFSLLCLCSAPGFFLRYLSPHRLWSSWACTQWAATPKCFSVLSSTSRPAGWGQSRTTSRVSASASALASV